MVDARTRHSLLREIPVWLRVLAGAVAVAAGLAIVLLVRGAPGRILDGPAFVGLAAQAILYLCVFLLFGYVATSGLPPSHWLRGAGHAWWPARTEPQLTPDLQRFLVRFQSRHPEVRECWFLDAGEQGEWWLFASSDGAGVENVRGDWDIRRKDVRLYLLDKDSQTVVLAWGRSSPVAFSTWDWEPQGDVLAEFRSPLTGEIRLAQRLWS